jgi:ribosome-binding factor A
MSEAKRADRVAERLRQELAWLVARDVRDPRVANVVIARVQMPDDLRSARVFVRLLEGGDVPERRKEALRGLGRASGMLRRLASGRMGLRYAPELSFVYDEGQDQLGRIEELLEEVKRERRGS